MRPDGWLFLIVSWGCILVLCGVCFRKIFQKHAKR